ncbi:MAG: carbohydrate esterase, partial [Prevotella sp.]|nr:carbohydrate esterase [Prevotella sp.]
MIRIFDCSTGKLVDQLDMSIPPGPTESQPRNPDAIYTPVPYQYVSQQITNRNTKPGTPSGAAEKAKDLGKYQLSIIGGFSDGFHFYPVM